MGEYTVSDKIANKISMLPKFRTDVHKLNIANVKRIYGIGECEKILAYKVIPKLFASLEKGGVVLTDQGIYRNLTSGLLKSDYTKYAVKYVEFGKYIPAMGLTNGNKPQLVNWDEDLWFWYDAITDEESNKQLYFVLAAIQGEVIAKNEPARLQYVNMGQTILKNIEVQLSETASLKTRELALLANLKEAGEFKEQAFILDFQYRFVSENYESAYSLNDSDSFLQNSKNYECRVNAMTIEKLEEIQSKKGLGENLSEKETEFLNCIIRMDAYTKSAVILLVEYHIEKMEFSVAYSVLDRISQQEELEEFIANQREKIRAEAVKYGQKAYQEALVLLDKAEYETAESKLKEAVQIDSENLDYRIALYKIEGKFGRYWDIRGEICNLLRENPVMTKAQREKLEKLAIEICIGLNKEMERLYSLLKNNGKLTDSSILQKTDQLGLTVFQYAILLGNYETVESIQNSSKNDVAAKAGYYPSLLFASGSAYDKNPNGKKIFNFLLEKNDSEIMELKRKYEMSKKRAKFEKLMPLEAELKIRKKERTNCMSEEHKYRKAASDSQYSEYERMNFRKKAEEIRTNEERVIREIYDLEQQIKVAEYEIKVELDPLIKEIEEMCIDKHKAYAELLVNGKLEVNNMHQRLVLLIIQKPEWLECIFNVKEDDFALVKDAEEGFLYLPKKLIEEAGAYDKNLVNNAEKIRWICKLCGHANGDNTECLNCGKSNVIWYKSETNK